MNLQQFHFHYLDLEQAKTHLSSNPCWLFMSAICRIIYYITILIVFTACPAYVSLEISHDGVTNTPQCQPLMTSSLAFIKLQLQRPQIATTLTIRLHKARDSMTIGLSQLMLMGYSAFGYTGSSTQNILLPTVDFISQSRQVYCRLNIISCYKKKKKYY